MNVKPASDLELLRRFARGGDEAAFAALVGRYANLVFGVALRRGVGREGAEDVTQKVFAVLARKARKLTRKASLAGWLSRTAALEATYLRRTESNRQRKMDNYQQKGDAPATGIPAVGDSEQTLWRKALPHLDEAISELPPADQEVILQRFYHEESFATIAALMNKTEAAVQKQARRALDKLSKLLRRKGVILPAAAIASALGSELSHAAPAAATSALAEGAISAAPAITGGAVITNTLNTMAYAKTKTAIAVAAVAAIPTGIQWNKINKLERELEGRPMAPAVQRASNDADLQALRQEIAVLKGKLAAAERAEPAVTALADNSNAGDAAAADDNPLAGFADMFEDPAMHELIKSQLKGQISMMYGEFIDSLDYDEAKRVKFEELLIDRQMFMAAKGMKVMNANSTPEEQAAAREALLAARDESNVAIEEMLGEEKYAEFERYEDSSNERMELTSFKQALARSEGDGLLLEEEQRLMEIMYEERKAFKFSNNFTLDSTEVPEWEMTAEAVEAISADYRTLHQQIAARAGEVLDEDRVKVFVENQDSYRKMMEAGLEMSVKMLGKGKSGDGG